MSRNDIAISVRGISKSYTIMHNEERHPTLAETALARLRNPFKRAERETFWALKDVSFDVKKGEVVGIIGRNGAGKSTLLKILSRITEPSSGRIELFGRVGALLEVGTGFHPELTGRENIYLNGAILGMTRADIRTQFDAIVSFAEVDKFIDTPVKRYSSGMYVRLAFAVAAHLEPEILIVDEVLAVGDMQFQKKCLGKMGDVAKQGRTVFFVSHNLAAVRVLCTRGMVLNSGSLTFEGDVVSAVDTYLKAQDTDALQRQSIADRPRHASHGVKARIVDLQINGSPSSSPPIIDSLQEVRFRLTVDCYVENCNISPEVVIQDSQANIILLHSGVIHNLVYNLGTGRHVFECVIPALNLYGGTYSAYVGLITLAGREVVDHVSEALELHVAPIDPYGSGFGLTRKDGFGLFHVDHAWNKL